MPTKYKVTYFKFYVRGEAIRQLLYLAEADFEDVTLEWDSAEWKALKPTLPNGQLPVLEFDGTVLCQSIVINRYLAYKFGLAGKTELDKLRGEMIVDCITDLLNPFEPIFEEPDEKKKAEMTEKYMPKFVIGLEHLQKMLEANKSNSGFFVGDSMTWVDILWASYFPWINYMKFGSGLEKFPKLLKVRDQVEATPRIKEWLSKRPQYPC